MPPLRRSDFPLGPDGEPLHGMPSEPFSPTGGFDFVPSGGITLTFPINSAQLAAHNLYIVDGSRDIFHSTVDVSYNEAPSPAVPTQQTVHYPEDDDATGRRPAQSTTTNNSSAAAPPVSAAPTAPATSRPMFIFGGTNNNNNNNNNGAAAATAATADPNALAGAVIPGPGVWAARGRGPPRRAAASAASAPSLLPPGTREAIRYRLTGAGISHRELALVSTMNDPPPVPAPVTASVVDMRDLLVALTTMPPLRLEGVLRDDLENDADDEDDRDSEEQVAAAAATLVDVAEADAAAAAAVAAAIAAANALVAVAAADSADRTISVEEDEDEDEDEDKE